jgi:hypothetical protein
MLGIVASLNAEKAHDAMPIKLLIPNCANGIVKLLENSLTTITQQAEICSFPINRIRFCVRGKPKSDERSVSLECKDTKLWFWKKMDQGI